MMKLRTFLVVDDSKLMRTILATVLKLQCERLVTAGSCKEALALLEENPDIELVLSDLYLGAGDAFELLESMRAREGHKPLTVLMTARWTQEAEDRALALGAFALLAKPIAVRDLSQAWRGEVELRKAARRCSSAPVFVFHPDGSPLVTANLRNISESGAFIETLLPVGEEIDIEIESGEARIRVRAVVVRVQEPSWTLPAGVGVAFQSPSEESRELLDELLASIEPPPAPRGVTDRNQ